MIWFLVFAQVFIQTATTVVDAPAPPTHEITVGHEHK